MSRAEGLADMLVPAHPCVMSTDYGSTPSERLRRLRDEAGLSQEQLAAELGLSVKTVTRIEKGAAAGAKAAGALARRFGCPIGWFLEESPVIQAAPPSDAQNRLLDLEAIIRVSLREQPGRWTEPTLAACRRLAEISEIDRSNAEWAAQMDMIEDALRRGARDSDSAAQEA